MTVKDMKEQRIKLITDAQKLVLGDTVTAEQRDQANRMVADVEKLEADINVAEKLERYEVESRETVRPPRGNPAASEAETREQSDREVRAFTHYIKTGEKRDLLTTNAGAVIPQVFNQNIIDAQKLVGNTLTVVGKKVTNNNGAPIKVALSNDTGNTLVTITGGEGTALTDTDPTFSGFVLNCDTLATMVKVSFQELEDASFDMGSWLKTKFGLRYYRGLEYIITNGNASNVASILTGATLAATSAVSATVTFDDLNAVYSALDPAYEGNASWVMSSTTRALIMGEKDTLGRPIFIPNPSSGVLDHLFGRPIVLNQALPSAFVASNVGIMYGDFEQGYLLRTDGDMSIRRLDERFADSLEVAFLAYARVGGASTDAGTHPLLKLATHA
jgi:HK97 family phage major capsid protein